MSQNDQSLKLVQKEITLLLFRYLKSKLSSSVDASQVTSRLVMWVISDYQHIVIIVLQVGEGPACLQGDTQGEEGTQEEQEDWLGWKPKDTFYIVWSAPSLHTLYNAGYICWISGAFSNLDNYTTKY